MSTNTVNKKNYTDHSSFTGHFARKERKKKLPARKRRTAGTEKDVIL